MLASAGKIKGQKEIIQIRNKRKRKVDDERSSQGLTDLKEFYCSLISFTTSQLYVSTEGPFQSEFCSCLAFLYIPVLLSHYICYFSFSSIAVFFIKEKNKTAVSENVALISFFFSFFYGSKLPEVLCLKVV